MNATIVLFLGGLMKKIITNKFIVGYAVCRDNRSING